MAVPRAAAVLRLRAGVFSTVHLAEATSVNEDPQTLRGCVQSFRALRMLRTPTMKNTTGMIMTPAVKQSVHSHRSLGGWV